MNINIRQYLKCDLDDLLTAWEGASRLAHPFMKDDFFEQERKNIPEIYLPNADTRVILIDNKVVGFIALIASEVDCEIGGLFVEPHYHGLGLGSALVDKAKSIHPNLVVKVFKGNTIGQQFYQRYGFKYVKELVWEETGDVLLELALT